MKQLFPHFATSFKDAISRKGPTYSWHGPNHPRCLWVFSATFILFWILKRIQWLYYFLMFATWLVAGCCLIRRVNIRCSRYNWVTKCHICSLRCVPWKCSSFSFLEIFSCWWSCCVSQVALKNHFCSSIFTTSAIVGLFVGSASRHIIAMLKTLLISLIGQHSKLLSRTYSSLLSWTTDFTCCKKIYVNQHQAAEF